MRLWTPDEDAILKASAEAGETTRQAADRVGRPQSAAQARAGRLGIRFNGQGKLTWTPTKELPTEVPELYGDRVAREDLPEMAMFEVERQSYDRWVVRGKVVDTYELVYRINRARRAKGRGPVLVRV